MEGIRSRVRIRNKVSIKIDQGSMMILLFLQIEKYLDRTDKYRDDRDH